MDQSKYDLALEYALSSPDDLVEIRNLLEISAAEGDSRAIYALASWELSGNSVTNVDIDHGMSRLKKISDENIPEALFDIAVSYDLGKSSRRNTRLAALYYMEAALLGDRESCQQVAEFFREGRYFPKSERLYRAWMKRASCEEREISPPYRNWLRFKQ